MIMKYILSLMIIANVYSLDISKILKKYNLDKDQVGISVLNTKTLKQRVSFNENKSFIPASTFKIVSAYYLLKNNDPQKKLKTSIYTTGKIKDGKLLGDIIIESEANPYFLTTNLYNLLYSLKEKGIKEIQGKVILEGVLPEIEKIGDVGLDDQSYNQSLSSFNINFNRFRLFNSGSTFYSLPKTSALKVTKIDSPLQPGEVVAHNKTDNNESWDYHKTSGNRHEIPVRNSKSYFLSYTEKILSNLGITIKGEVLKSSSKELITTDTSLNYERLIELALEYSNNLFMEILLLDTTKKETLESAAIVMKKYLGDDFKNIAIKNASGLDVDLLISPNLFTTFLAKIYNEKIGEKYFFSYLSLAGSSGFIANRFLSSELNEKFFAKTGSLDYVNNICGVSFKNSEEIFCIFINDFEKRKILQGLNSQKLEDLRINAKGWKNQTDKALDELVREIL